MRLCYAPNHSPVTCALSEQTRGVTTTTSTLTSSCFFSFLSLHSLALTLLLEHPDRPPLVSLLHIARRVRLFVIVFAVLARGSAVFKSVYPFVTAFSLTRHGCVLQYDCTLRLPLTFIASTQLALLVFIPPELLLSSFFPSHVTERG